MKCQKCQIKILYPQRPFAVIEDDVYCSKTCFSYSYESISFENNSNSKERLLLSLENNSSDCEEDCFDSWKGAGYCAYCNLECNPASQTCKIWPRCY